MGSKPSETESRQLEKQLYTIHHARFTKVKLLTDKTGEYLQIAVHVVGQSQIKNWQKKFKTFISHDCLMLPLSYEFKGTELCGSNGICKINYDNYPYLLKDQIHDRAHQTVKPFEKEQLWYLCYTLLEAASIFHSTGRKIGDVQPGNIFINDNGQAKVANQFSWPQESVNYQKSVFEKQITYLAPEQIKELQFGHTEPQSNFQLAESFSIGLTLLDSAILTNSIDLYNFKNYRFDYQTIDKRLQNLKSSSLDQPLKQIIAGLCQVEPSDRLNSSQIYKWLVAYKQKIINIEPFQIGQLPAFLNKTNNQSSVKTVRPIPQPIPVPSQPMPIPSQITSGYVPKVYVDGRTYLPAQTLNRPLIHVNPKPSQFSTLKTSEVIRVGELQPRYPVSSASIDKSVEYSRTDPLNGLNDDFRGTLNRIEQQLAISRKMFPS